MKRTIKTIPCIICATAFCAVVLAGPSAKANSITGSIGFGASGVTINTLQLASASTFSVSSPFTTTETGTYSSVPMLTPVSFTGFAFNPPVASVTPLWTFTIGLTSYSFAATSVSSYFDSSLDQWDIGGTGMAMITGFSTTPGTWNVNLSQSGTSFVFDSSEGVNAASVPDGGSSLALLGTAAIGLSVFGRKARR
jgi:hypothetical protein